MAYRKYNKTFKFCNTEQEAREMCESINRAATRYIRTKRPAHYTPWSSADGKEHKFIVWFVR